ncbi:tetratricopeptide repeat protein [Shouchella clausii]|uniref:tetratricopeptide repeat protein n=1 Tax=Shouchella clausii TaxID=79880 RepID=UPI001FE6B9C8|nr:tetratricopeptide repeat protein [Shouchella clausii]
MKSLEFPLKGGLNKRMDMSAIPFNLDFYFDENLREVPLSKAEMMKGIEFLKKQIPIFQNDKNEIAKIYGLMGVYLRIVKELEESKKYLRLAIQTYESTSNDNSLFVNKLRLAHTYQWQKDFHTSNQMFKKLMEEAEICDERRGILDFVYQHYAKNLFDQENYDLAISYFHKALNLRIQKGQKDLIESTEYAIHICKGKL